FCINQPVIHIVAEVNSQNMLKDSNVIKTINENVAFDYPHSSTLSLNDKYSQHYYSTDVPLIRKALPKKLNGKLSALAHRIKKCYAMLRLSWLPGYPW
ncbi:fatty acid synthase-like, partial [Aphis craccivora]